MTSDRYSRLISWLKVLFPLTALALLSTLFLLSRATDPESQIPFADKEIQDRLRDQQVTGPFFSGTSADGDQISFSAEKLTTPQGQTGANEALDVRAEVDLASGANVTLTAERAHFNMAQDRAELAGSVVVATSTGYTLTSDLFTAEMSSLNLKSPGAVEGTGPAGHITAGGMTLSKPESSDSAQLVFTNGVKLVYTPSDLKE
ncbi:MAG: LPS export ABC transporter periplasmic protein LptC [Sulfitobacter sp.]